MSQPPIPPAVAMIQMLGGFQLSQALYVVAKLGVPDALQAGSRPVAEVAGEVGADPDALLRLVRDLTGVGVFAQSGPGTFGLGPLGPTLCSGPGSMRDLALMWMETHYAAFGALLHTARTGEPAATKHYGESFWSWIARDPEQVSRFSAAMGNLTGGLKAGAIASYDFPGAALLVDVGGASGAVLAQFLLKSPSTRGIVFDLPHVVADAAPVMAAAGLADRVEIAAGSFFDFVPSADAYILSHVLHDWSDAECIRILDVIRKHAQPGARILVLELVLPDDDAPHMGKMIDITMLGMVTGRERTEADWRALADAAGCRVDRIVATPTAISILELSFEPQPA